MRAIAGADIHVVDRGDGPGTRLYLHCSLASHATLLPLAAALPPARTILFDLPGHGASAAWDGQGDYQARCVAICQDVLADMPRPIEVVGHSFGATVALHLALATPGLVDRLGLIDSVFFAAARGSAAHASHAREFAPFAQALDKGDPETAAQVFLDLWGLPGSWARLSPAQRAALASQIHLVPAAAPAMEQDCHDQLAPGRLEGLACPVVLIEGALTQPVVFAINDTLAARLPRVTRHRIEGAGHMVALTHATACAAALVDGLTG